MASLRRWLDGDDMHMGGSDDKLPDGVWHSVSCKGYREVSYENSWMIPFCLLLCVLTPYGWLLRMDGSREGDYEKRKRGYFYLFAVFFINLIFLVFENGINHSPEDQTPYSNKIIYGCYMMLLPIYVFLRDNGVLCAPNAACCGRRGKYSELFCMAMGEFWDYGMMAIGAVGVPVCGLWSAMACHDVQIEIGHWVPFLGFLAYGGVLLYFGGPARKQGVNLQYAEGWCWIAWGLVFNIYFTPGSGGGLLYPLFHNGQTSPRWMPDQQHIFQAVYYIFVGAMGITLGKMGVRTGFHILLLGIAMFSMLQVHQQWCLLAADMHKIGGILFLFVGLLRYFDKILEASLMMTVLAGAFVFSSSCTVTWGDANFERISFVTMVVMLWSSWWLYVAYLFQDHWNMPLSAEQVLGEHANGEAVHSVLNGKASNKTKYSHIKPEDEDDMPLESGN